MSSIFFPMCLAMLSAHLIFGLPGCRFVVDFHLVNSRAQLSLILAMCPAHCHFFLRIISNRSGFCALFESVVCDMILPFDIKHFSFRGPMGRVQSLCHIFGCCPRFCPLKEYRHHTLVKNLPQPMLLTTTL